MKKFVTRAIIIALIGSTGILSGCYGPFRLTTKLHQWNGNVSNKKFVNELVFLGLCILPAYELCTLGDVLIFNSIEFWGGQNPITMKDGQIDESEFMHEGSSMVSRINSLEKGRAEGMNQRSLDIARNMLADGVDINLIMKYSGLTQEQIEKLK